MNSRIKKFEWKANLLCHCNLLIRKSKKVYAFEGPPISKTYCYCQSQEILFIQHLQMVYFWRNSHDQMHFFSWRAKKMKVMQALQRGPGVLPWEKFPKQCLLDATNSFSRALSAATGHDVIDLLYWIYPFFIFIESWGSDLQLW